MSEQPAWSGRVDANLENGQATGLKLKNGDVISVVASGYVKFGPGDTEWSDPLSPIPLYKSDFNRNPALVALFDTDTNKTYPIGNGMFNWTVPVDGELIFKFVDSNYEDNKGSFDVEVTREAAGGNPDPSSGTWTGILHATAEHGVKTGVTLHKGDTISIVASGGARWERSGGYPYYGPDGATGVGSAGNLLDSAVPGAVLMRIGSDPNPYRLVGSGLSNYSVQEEGEIAFFYNWNRDFSGYDDNLGLFQITLTKK